MDLADKIIDANEREQEEQRTLDEAPEGFYTDDMGMWVEKDIKSDDAKFARYVFTRCRKLNKHLYYDPDDLTVYNHHTAIRPTPSSIIGLARLADSISTAQAIWVYNKLKETIPRLDRDRVLVARDLAWNIKTSELEELEEGTYTTVGGEK